MDTTKLIIAGVVVLLVIGFLIYKKTQKNKSIEAEVEEDDPKNPKKGKKDKKDKKEKD